MGGRGFVGELCWVGQCGYGRLSYGGCWPENWGIVGLHIIACIKMSCFVMAGGAFEDCTVGGTRS